MNASDRKVSGYLQEWRALGGVRIDQFEHAKALYQAGELQSTRAELEAVADYQMMTGGWALVDRDASRYYDGLNEFFSDSGIGCAGDQIAGESLDNYRKRNGM